MQQFDCRTTVAAAAARLASLAGLQEPHSYGLFEAKEVCFSDAFPQNNHPAMYRLPCKLLQAQHRHTENRSLTCVRDMPASIFSCMDVVHLSAGAQEDQWLALCRQRGVGRSRGRIFCCPCEFSRSSAWW